MKRKVKGKLIGAAIGTLAGPLGIAVGALIGHLYDARSDDRFAAPERFASRENGAVRKGRGSSLGLETEHFLSSLAGLAVAVARCDGEIEPTQLRRLKSFFAAHLGTIAGERVAQIIDEAARDAGGVNVGMLAIRFGNLTPFEGRLLLLRVLFTIARSDPRGISPAKEALILRVAGLLGLKKHLPGIRAEFISTEDRAYRILGLPRSAGAEEVRRAYRRLASIYHPDRVCTLGEEFVRLAEEKIKVINDAYDEIRKSRVL